MTLDRPALRAAAPRTIAASPAGAGGTWALPAPYWSSGTSVQVQDPAVAIRASLLQDLAERYALGVIDDRTPDLVLEVQTTRWDYRVVRKLFRPGQVAFVYGATLKLKDRRTGKLLAEGSCDIHQATAPMTDEALHDPKLFPAEIRKTAAYCTDDFGHRVLGL